MAGGDIPPVRLKIAADGATEAKAAIRSIRDATIDAARATSRERQNAQREAVRLANEERKAFADALKGKRDAEKASLREKSQAERAAANESKKLAKEVADEQKKQAKAAADAAKAARIEASRDLFGNRTAASDRGLRQLSSSRAFSDMFGKTTAQLLGLQGTAGILAGSFHALSAGVHLARQALTAFASYTLNDVIKPQLELGTKATQISNRIGGGTSGGQIQGAINELFGKNAQADLKQVTEVFDLAATKTKDFAKAKDVADVALSAQKAYGYDPKKIAEFAGAKRWDLAGLNSADFKTAMFAQLAQLSQGSANADDFAANAGKINLISERFGVGGSAADKVARDNQVTGLIGAGASNGVGSAKSIAGLSALVNDLARDPKFHATTADGLVKRLDLVIPQLLQATHGNIDLYGPGKRAGALGGVQVGALSPAALNFLRNLGVADTYKQGGGGAGGLEDVKAQLQKIFDPATAASDALVAQQKVEEDAGYQLDAAMRSLKMTLVDAILPTLQKDGPKIAEAIKSLAQDIASADLGGVFKAVGQGMASVLYHIMDISGSSDAKTKKKLGQLAGILPEDGSNTPAEPGVIERLRNSEKHDLAGVSTLKAIASGFVNPLDSKATQLAEPANATGVTETMIGRGVAAGRAPGLHDGGLTEAFNMKNQGIGAHNQKLDAAAAAMLQAAEILKGVQFGPHNSQPLSARAGIK